MKCNKSYIYINDLFMKKEIQQQQLIVFVVFVLLPLKIIIINFYIELL